MFSVTHIVPPFYCKNEGSPLRHVEKRNKFGEINSKKITSAISGQFIIKALKAAKRLVVEYSDFVGWGGSMVKKIIFFGYVVDKLFLKSY